MDDDVREAGTDRDDRLRHPRSARRGQGSDEGEGREVDVRRRQAGLANGLEGHRHHLALGGHHEDAKEVAALRSRVAILDDEVDDGVLFGEGDDLLGLVAQRGANFLGGERRHLGLADLDPPVGDADRDLLRLEVASGPQSLERLGHGHRVDDLAVDDRTRRQGQLAEPMEGPRPRLTRDLRGADRERTDVEADIVLSHVRPVLVLVMHRTSARRSPDLGAISVIGCCDRRPVADASELRSVGVGRRRASASRARYSVRGISTTPSDGEVVGAPLHVEEGIVGQQFDQPDERNLRRIGPAVEHRLAGEEAPDGDAVEPAGQGPVVERPGLDAVDPAEAMELEVGGPDLGRDPSARAGRVAACVDDRPRSRRSIRISKRAHDLRRLRLTRSPSSGQDPPGGRATTTRGCGRRRSWGTAHSGRRRGACPARGRRPRRSGRRRPAPAPAATSVRPAARPPAFWAHRSTQGVEQCAQNGEVISGDGAGDVEPPFVEWA